MYCDGCLLLLWEEEEGGDDDDDGMSVQYMRWEGGGGRET